MANRPSPRGLTVLELVIALAASAVVVAGAVGAALAQQAAFQRSAQVRAAQSSARAAQLFLQEKLRLAGLGMDPALAFDFGVYAPASYATFPCPAEANGCPRDATDGSDELVFYARNPGYWVGNDLATTPVGRAWRILGTGAPDNAAAITADAVEIQASEGDTFLAGQILAAVCPAGRYYAYMTVSATTTLHAGPGTIPLEPSDGTNPFRRQDFALAPGGDPARYFASAAAVANPMRPSACFSSGQARLFQIDRYRFHVRPVAMSAGGGVTRYDPYLMLDMGVDTNRDGTVNAADELVVAEGVEIMQVAYVMTNGGLPTPVVGTTAGTPITFTPGLPGATGTADEISTLPLPPALPLTFTFAPRIAPEDNPYAVVSWYPYSLTQPFPADHPRMTDAQANIRAVRVALVVRSPEPDLQAVPSIVLDDTFSLYNLDTIPPWIADNAYPSAALDGFQRVQVETTVVLPNMSARGMAYF